LRVINEETVAVYGEEAPRQAGLYQMEIDGEYDVYIILDKVGIYKAKFIFLLVLLQF
jgi:hypothetical protein